MIDKGQIKLKADWRAVDSHKKRKNELEMYAFHHKQNKFVFLFANVNKQIKLN